MAVTTSILVPSTAPTDVAGMAMFMTTMMQQLQLWIASAATQLNGFGEYTFKTNSDNELVAVAKNGIETVIARPFEPQP